MNKKDQREDFKFLVNKFRDAHIACMGKLKDEQLNIVKYIEEKIKEGTEELDFALLLNEFVCSFKDAHSSINISGYSKRMIDLNLIWLDSGIYVLKSLGPVKQGDKLLSIGRMNNNELLEELWKIIPSENEYWIKSSIYLIKYEIYLRKLGLINKDEKVELELLRDGKKVSVEMKIYDIKRRNQYNVKNNFISYKIDKDKNIGILKLKKCIYNEEYKDTLKKFFYEVKENKLKSILLDLRDNTGGNSSVCDEFIRYIDIDAYNHYGINGYISEELKSVYPKYMDEENGFYIHKGKENIINEKVDKSLLFDGDVNVIINNRTFSSGMMFAVLLSDNNMAKVLGEPLGNKPSNYGDIITFKLPNSELEFSVSWKQFTRPKEESENEDTLVPDIQIYRTFDEIVNNNNKQLNRAIEYITERCE
ncbi:MAG: S41 family peptidase [Clostridia bacterium]|jgi:hypothetical protein|nr:S41 family peptidase [Clostridia bacterium]